jgi:hypothetical protein
MLQPLGQRGNEAPEVITNGHGCFLSKRAAAAAEQEGSPSKHTKSAPDFIIDDRQHHGKHGNQSPVEPISTPSHDHRRHRSPDEARESDEYGHTRNQSPRHTTHSNPKG